MSRFCRLLAVLTAVWGVLATAQQALAIGDEYEVRSDDLIVVVNTRWAGNTHGGYYPVRVRITNRGESRTLTLRFVPEPGGLPAVGRTVQSDQNATLQLTLSIPMVGRGNYGRLEVLHDGSVLKSFTRQLSLPSAEPSHFERPALLVVSELQVDCTAFEKAVTALSVPAAGSSSYGWGYRGSMRTEDHEVVAPGSLPTGWIDYTGLDIVAISLPTLAALEVERRTALLAWVQCGGTLLVYDVGAAPDESEELATLLGSASSADVWRSADATKRRQVETFFDPQGNLLPNSHSSRLIAQDDATMRWVETGAIFFRRKLMLGEVYAFASNPFPGNIHDWDWFLATLTPHRFQWMQRNGMSARLSDPDEFLNFLIPGVGDVPVYAFLGLITAFTIVIGPLNYLLLWRKRKLYLLLVSIPAIALLTTTSLFAYSILAHGFGVKSRARTLTVLDQHSKTAVNISRIALYAGLAPSDGLRFSPETAVFPLWPYGLSFENGSVDWTLTQALEAGWLKSRTRTQFVTVSHGPARGRITVEDPAGGRLSVTNGLEWELEALVVSDAAQQMYFGTDILAGAGAQLNSLTPEDRKTLAQHLMRNVPAPPPGVDPDSASFFELGNLANPYPEEQAPPVRFKSNRMELEIEQLRGLTALPARSYAAILKQNPGVELGVEGTDEFAGYHVLIGYY